MQEKREVIILQNKYNPKTKTIDLIPTGIKGIFHEWGVEYEEFEAGPGNYSVAIIEMPDGKMITAEPKYIQFVNQTRCPDCGVEIGEYKEGR